MSIAPVSNADSDHDRRFTRHVVASLREDYRLRIDEAEHALSLYLRHKAGWATPDQAAFQAYRWWSPTVDQSVLLAREAEQRAHARLVGTGTDAFDVTVDDDHDRSRAVAVQTDLDGAESALALIREEGQDNGFTNEQVELARKLRLVLDESPVWDSISPTEAAADWLPGMGHLEPALRPDTVRERVGWDDIIVIDAGFAGTTITVLRTPGGLNPASYVFLCDTPGGRGEQQAADSATVGMIAAGDRAPDLARVSEYENLGKQVRNHLMGLADVVADTREAWQEQQARHLEAAAAAPSPEVKTRGGRNRAALGSTQ